MDLSAEPERRCFDLVDGASGFDEAIDGEKATAYTGAECPIRRRDGDGGGSLALGGSEEGKALPSRLHTRM